MVAESVTSRQKMSRDHFLRSISRDTNVEVSAFPPYTMIEVIDCVILGWSCLANRVSSREIA